MLCPHCGSYAGDNEILCPGCGALLDHGENQEEGVRAIRQGRGSRGSGTSSAAKHGSNAKAGASRIYVDASVRGEGRERVYADPQVFSADGTPLATGYERPVRGVYGDTTRQQTMLPRDNRRRKKHPLSKRMINWTHVFIGMMVLVVMMMVGAYLYLTRTHEGQKIMARMGRDATSAAIWEVGEEVLDTGAVDQAIGLFEKARAQDGEESVNVNGLLVLGSAYEAAGRVDEAEALYRQIYTDIVPSAPEAYRNVIRILLASGRAAEAGELMQTAYEQTGMNTFRQQRTELLPQSPMVDLTAGYYTEKKTITLTSPQGYDVYYTFDETKVLPEEGTLYTEPIFLGEGSWALRAVSVSTDLVSDPLSATYQIYMPSPQAPQCSLAPNTYHQRQRVRLWPGKDNEKDDDITIYYTIDGSLPDADSPIYTGEPFRVPGGNVTIRAVAVNGFGKSSTTKEVKIKVEAKPWPLKSYNVSDTANGLELYKTTREQFLEAYGAGSGKEDVMLDGFETACQKYSYEWGYAIFTQTRNGWVMAELYFTGEFVGPRSTGIGNTEEDVVGKFRDMGQLESPSGNRGLYENDDGKGKIYKQEDGTKIIRYQAETADSRMWQLDYILSTGGVVEAIDMLYVP